MSQANSNAMPLHAMDPESAFSNRGVDYSQYRPSYPAAAIDTILEGLGEPSQLTAADVGAGTGIASRLLAERGLRVIAIEPNVSMRDAAGSPSLVEFHEATAERTNLPDASVDLLTSFQAFHWFNPTTTLSEFRRILKSSGRLAIIWNSRAADDKFFAEFDRLVKSSIPQPLSGKPRAAAMRRLLSSPHFTNVHRHTFTHRHELDLHGTIGYALSKSFVPREGPVYQQLISELKELHARWADERGFVSFALCTSVYLTEPNLYGSGKFRTPVSRWFLTVWQKLNHAVTRKKRF